ncbi:MAG: uroporphyrinogen-III C-methyltransferase [Pigmentiphaga sp.]
MTLPDSSSPSTPLPEANAAAGQGAPLRAEPRASRFPWVGLGLVLVFIAAVILAAMLWRQQQLVDVLGRESARRFDTINTVANESQRQAKQALALVQTTHDKVTVLESKLLESLSEQAALQELYQDLARGEDEWTLVEVEQVISIASQQLQLAANVSNAIAALEVADARLARADRPSFMLVRRAIAQDLEKLKSLPSVDVSGLILRLDQISQQIDRLPLLSSVEAGSKPAEDAPASEQAPTVQPGAVWWKRTLEWTAALKDDLLQDAKALIRIRRIDQPGALLVSPEQGALLKENLKLRLLNARQSLLSRQEKTWKSDLNTIQTIIPQYFDVESPQTQHVLRSLRQIQETHIAIELPTLQDSLNAVREAAPRRNGALNQR